MSVKVDNSGSAPVNKSFVSKHKKELLLVAGLVAGVALGLLVSPDIGIGVGAVAAFMYGASKLLAPQTRQIAVNRIPSEKCDPHTNFVVDSQDANNKAAPTTTTLNGDKPIFLGVDEEIALEEQRKRAAQTVNTQSSGCWTNGTPCWLEVK